MVIPSMLNEFTHELKQNWEDLEFEGFSRFFSTTCNPDIPLHVSRCFWYNNADLQWFKLNETEIENVLKKR